MMEKEEFGQIQKEWETFLCENKYHPEGWYL